MLRVIEQSLQHHLTYLEWLQINTKRTPLPRPCGYCGASLSRWGELGFILSRGCLIRDADSASVQLHVLASEASLFEDINSGQHNGTKFHYIRILINSIKAMSAFALPANIFAPRPSQVPSCSHLSS